MIDSLSTIVFYLAILGACFYLWRRAPDSVQKCVLALISVAMGMHVFAEFLYLYGVGRDGVEFLGIDRVWRVKLYAYVVMHWAVLFYVVRLAWVQLGVCRMFKTRARRAGDAR